MKIKKSISLLLTSAFLLLLLLALATTTFAESIQSNTENPTWNFHATSGTLTISGEGVLSKPSHKRSDDWEDITSLVIEEGITEIDPYAFSNCHNLTEVYLPLTLTSIGEYAFANCTSLRQIVLPQDVTFVGDGAFSGCTSLETVEVFNRSCRIGSYEGSAQETLGVPGLTVILGTTYSTAEEYALQHGHNFEYIYPIYYGNCGDALMWTLDSSTWELRIFGQGELYDCDEPWLMYSVPTFPEEEWDSECHTGIVSVVIEEGVTGIGSYVLGCNADLVSVSLPTSLLFIGSFSFSDCPNLTEVSLVYDGSLFLGEGVFDRCENLSSDYKPWICGESASWNFDRYTGTLFIYGMGELYSTAPWESLKDLIINMEIDLGITNLPNYDLYTYPNLVQITLPGSLTTVDEYAFYLSTVKKVILGEGLTEIFPYMFDGCHGLEEVVLPESLTVIGMGAFNSCYNLSTVTLPENLTTIGCWAFSGTNLTTIEIPENITVIDHNVFSGCSNLESVILHEGVREIGSGAFSDCTSLSGFYFPQSIYYIDDGAFSGCTGLYQLYLPEGLSSISPRTFSGCSSLSYIYFPESITSIGEEAFSHCTSLVSIEIPQSVNYIGRSAFGDCTALERVEIYSPDCAIGGEDYCSIYGVIGTTVFYGYENSTSQAYAEKYGYTFVALDAILDENVTMRHTLDLASDISLNFAVTAAQLEGYDSYYLECIVAGDREHPIRIEPDWKDNICYFPLEGLTAFQMNDRVEATLHMVKAGIPYVSPLDNYSIADYAYRQLNNPAASHKLKKVCANLLQYGAAAQLWKNCPPESLVTAPMTEEHKVYLRDLSTVTFQNNNKTLNDLENPMIPWVGKTLSLENKVIIRFVFDASNYNGNLEDLNMRVSYVNAKGESVSLKVTDLQVFNAQKNHYAFELDSLNSPELRTVVSAVICEGDTPISVTAQYSVDSYGNNRTGSLLTLCKAMIAYGDAAEEFFA